MTKGERKERIIICAICGKQVVTTARRTLYCPECAKHKKVTDDEKRRKEKRIQEGDNPENDLIHFHDSPEEIQECLNCKRKTCRNCLELRKKRRNDHA